MSRDSLFIQLHELKAQRAGISPKLGLHQTLTKQIEEIRAQIGGLDHDIPRKIQVRHVVVKEISNPCNHRKRSPKCIIPACTKLVRSKGKRSCGHTQYSNYCKKHGVSDL